MHKITDTVKKKTKSTKLRTQLKRKLKAQNYTVYKDIQSKFLSKKKLNKKQKKKKKRKINTHTVNKLQ